MSSVTKRASEHLVAVKQGIGLALHFDWIGDRFAQRIQASLGDGIVPLATSIQVLDGGNSLGLPAFQEIHRQRISDSELIFLVGAADGAYWSASVECLPSGRGFQWDVSCKGASTERLASCYELADAPQHLTPSCAVGGLPNGWEWKLETVAPFASTLTRVEPYLRIETAVPHGQGKTPVRWKYRWQVQFSGAGDST